METNRATASKSGLVSVSVDYKTTTTNTILCITSTKHFKIIYKNIFDSGSGYNYKSLKTLVYSGFVFFKIGEVSA
jgi:hypothetical protein